MQSSGVLRGWSIAILLLALYSCENRPRPPAAVPAAQLPPDVTMNEDAGRGNWLFVTLNLESGEALPFFLDTGATVTCLDKSLESKLGVPLGTGKLQHYGETIEAGIYPAPKLYLGGVPLITGSNAITVDFTKGSSDAGRPVMGVLGQDCLQHYCIQLDFQSRRLRFLDSNQPVGAHPGRAFPLIFSGKNEDIRPVIYSQSFFGVKAINLIVDTGNAHDGDVETGLFRREVKQNILRVEVVNGRPVDRARLPSCVWNGETYTNLLIGSGVNSIGLRFLARHLVTLDFPKRTMYLKRTNSDR